MPEEYLPPNKILFLQNLPENVTKDQLTALFSQYVLDFWYHYMMMLTYGRYPNLYEVRLIPTKRDIAFVEYMDENSASVAKDALHNYKLDGESKVKVHPGLTTFDTSLTASFGRLHLQESKLEVRHDCRYVYSVYLSNYGLFSQHSERAS